MNLKWMRFVLPAAAASAAAAGAAVFLRRKVSSLSDAGKPAPVPAAVSVSPISVREASYSFISGFQDAVTVEVCFPYDPERFIYEVAEDSFPAESGDSHVGVLRGDAFSAQLEYGSYYSGEDYDRLRQELSRKHSDLAEADYGPLSGLKFRDGDNLCLVFPIPEDPHSYLLITLLKSPDNDDELEALPDYPDLRFMLSSLSFRRS